MGKWIGCGGSGSRKLARKRRGSGGDMEDRGRTGAHRGGVRAGQGRCYGSDRRGCKVEATFECCLRSPEARQLRMGQRLRQLEDARHAPAAAGQKVVVEAASADQSGAERQRLVTVEGAESNQRSSAIFAHLRLFSREWGSTSASLRMPDMSVPPLVRKLLSRLRARPKRSRASKASDSRECKVQSTFECCLR